MTDHAVIACATSLAGAADIAAVNSHREALLDWLEARSVNSPTVIALLLTVLLGECLVASQTAVRSRCDDPGCPDCADVPDTITAAQVADAVMLMFNRLKRLLPADGRTDLEAFVEAFDRVH